MSNQTFSATFADLSPDQRNAVELLLGRPVDVEARVSVMAFSPEASPSAAQKASARTRLEQFFEQADLNLGSHKVDEQDIDDAIEEAIQSVRKHPHA